MKGSIGRADALLRVAEIAATPPPSDLGQTGGLQKMFEIMIAEQLLKGGVDPEIGLTLLTPLSFLLLQAHRQEGPNQITMRALFDKLRTPSAGERIIEVGIALGDTGLHVSSGWRVGGRSDTPTDDTRRLALEGYRAACRAAQGTERASQVNLRTGALIAHYDEAALLLGSFARREESAVFI